MNRLTYKENDKWCIELHSGIVNTGPKVDYIARLENIAAEAPGLCDNLELTARAFNIACEGLVLAGLCLYEDRSLCKKKEPTQLDCTICLGQWIINKAKEELRLLEL